MAHSKFLSKQVRLFVIVLAGVSMVSLLGCPPLNFKTVPDVVGMDQAAAAASTPSDSAVVSSWERKQESSW